MLTTSSQINRSFNAGATITAGQAVYLDTSNTWQKAKADASTTVNAQGLALHAAGSGQPLAVITGGDVTIGAGVVGTVYVVAADTAGAIAPNADLGSGNFVTVLGVVTVSTGSGVLALNINATGIAKA